MPANILARVSNKLSFAHLTGLAKGKSESKPDDDKAEEEDEDKKERDHEDGDASRAEDSDDKKDQAAAEDDDEEQDEKKSKKTKSKKADDDEDDTSAEDDDDDEEMRGKSAAASARNRERSRCAAIFASPAAAKNVELAANLAFKTKMGRKEALAVLESTPSAQRGHPNRSAKNASIGPGGTSAPTSSQASASSWDAAMKKVGAKK